METLGKGWQTALLEDAGTWEAMTGYNDDIIARVEINRFFSKTDMKRIAALLSGEPVQHDLGMTFVQAMAALFGCRAMMLGRITAPELSPKDIQTGRNRRHWTIVLRGEDAESILRRDRERAAEGRRAISVLCDSFPLSARVRWERIFTNIAHGGPGIVKHDGTKAGRKKGRQSSASEAKQRELVVHFHKSKLTQVEYLGAFPNVKRSTLQRALRKASKKLH